VAVKQRSLIKVFEPFPPSYKELEPFLMQIERNNWFTNFGPLHDDLICKFSKYFNFPSNQIVLFPNATLAIAGAIAALNLKNKQWLVPSWTFAATPSAIIFGGGTPYFVDIDEEWRAKLHKKNGNLVDVLPFGDSLRENLNETKGDYQIIDGAASFDSLRGFKLPSNKSVGVIVSLHATKLMSTGEGGVFITNNESWANSVRDWTRFGFQNGKRVSNFVGINAKFSEYQAALGLVSFKNWQTQREKILKLNSIVLDLTLRNGFEASPATFKGYATPYWILKTSSKKQKINLVKNFAQLRIETRDWWESGCATMPAFKRFKKDSLSATYKTSNEVVGLPFHLNLSDKDFDRIDSALNISR
jgi:dTDP-4-amino-4,6-dideoxygalactose transaminase